MDDFARPRVNAGIRSSSRTKKLSASAKPDNPPTPAIVKSPKVVIRCDRFRGSRPPIGRRNTKNGTTQKVPLANPLESDSESAESWRMAILMDARKLPTFFRRKHIARCGNLERSSGSPIRFDACDHRDSWLLDACARPLKSFILCHCTARDIIPDQGNMRPRVPELAATRKCVHSNPCGKTGTTPDVLERLSWGPSPRRSNGTIFGVTRRSPTAPVPQVFEPRNTQRPGYARARVT